MPIYSDINSINPTSDPGVTDRDAVYQSVLNIIQTRKYEIDSYPLMGVDLEDIVFENINDGVAIKIYDRVISAIQREDPRVSVVINETILNANTDNNTLSIDLAFKIAGFDDTYHVSAPLR